VSEIKQLAAALVKAQKAFGPALKSSTNPHFKSKYADLAACVEAVVDALNANGIALVQRTEASDTGVIVSTVFLHESGEAWDSGTLHVPAAKNDPQGYGSALTYARRYSLMAACGIAPEDDDGNAASKPKAAAEPDGYADWLLDIEAVAESGEQVLLKTIKDSRAEFKDRLRADTKRWAALKAKAQQVAA